MASRILWFVESMHGIVGAAQALKEVTFCGIAR